MLKRLELLFKSALLGAIRPVLKKRNGGNEKIDLDRILKILIIRPEKIGDVFISFPLIDCIKKSAPHLKVSILASRDGLPIIEGDPRFERVFLYQKKSREDLENLYAMRDEKFDVIIDLVGRDSLIYLILGRMIAKGAVFIGMGKEKNRKYYDFNYDLRCGNTGHVIANTLKAAEAFGIECIEADGFAPPYISEEDQIMARGFMKTFPHDGKLIGINLTAGAAGRTWPEKNVIKLADMLRKENSRNGILYISTPDKRDLALKLSEETGKGVFVIPENLSLRGVSAIIRCLDCLITPDTSLVHIARSFGVPVVGLYTRFMDNYKIWGPYGQDVGQIVSDNPDNIYDITPERVLQTYRKVIDISKQEDKCRSSR